MYGVYRVKLTSECSNIGIIIIIIIIIVVVVVVVVIVITFISGNEAHIKLHCVHEKTAP